MGMRLYGAGHHGTAYLWGCLPVNLDMSPSKEIIYSLSALPNGSRVAIEFYRGMTEGYEITKSDLVVEGIKLCVHETDRNYWQRILDVCRHNEHNVFLIDDLRRKGVSVKYMIETAKRKRWLDESDAQLDLFVDLEEMRNQRKGEIYALDIASEHLTTFSREKSFLGQIREIKPDITIVGFGHCDFFITNPYLLGGCGITVDRYGKEELPEDSMKELTRFPDHYLEYGTPFPVQNVMAANHKPPESVNHNRESLMRRIRALENGRVCKNGKPDYIGTFCVPRPPEGLFEVYIQKNENGKISGIIEDILGTAYLEGWDKNGLFNFRKNYSPGAIHSNVSQNELLYDGWWNGTGTEVTGNIIVPGEHEHNIQLREKDMNRFTMKPFGEQCPGGRK